MWMGIGVGTGFENGKVKDGIAGGCVTGLGTSMVGGIEFVAGGIAVVDAIANAGGTVRVRGDAAVYVEAAKRRW